MKKERIEEFNNWYSEYCKVNKQSPLWGEMLKKAKELGLERIP